MKQKASRKPIEKDTQKNKALRIIDMISEGASVRKAREAQGMTNTAFFGLLRQDAELMEQYARARENKGEACLDRIEEIEQALSEGKLDPSSARVLIDAEKWKACKFYPKMYGEKATVDMNVRSFSLFEKSVEEKAKIYEDSAEYA